MYVFDETGARWRLGEQVAAGGEGSVFRLPECPEWCVKLYHKRPLAEERRAKLSALRALSPNVRTSAALPLSLVAASAHSLEWIGVLLPFVEGHDMYELYNPQGRRSYFQHATFEFVVAAALNLARAFEAVHAHGIVVGDVSEQNIRVRPDATLTLIDCDGFQLKDGSRFFASNIGTPIWTPPELQGVPLEGTVRTRNHDGFGLAQLIFLLLFGGRYPFAGRPLTGQALSPEEAIAKFAFAFDPAPARLLLEPPPGAPRLDALPERFTTLFLRAFREGSEAPDARPSAAEWGAALGELREGLVRCASWQAHVYWKGALQCPWCGVLESVGVDLFPGPPVERRKNDAGDVPDLRALSKRLLALDLKPIHPGAPSVAAVHEALQESGVLAGPWWGPLSKRLGPLGGFLVGAQRRALLQELAEATQAVAAFNQKAANLYLGHAAGLRALGHRARQLGEELQAAAAWAEQAIERYREQHRNVALRRYLEAFLLRRYEIHGISPGKKAALLSHNIVTAADVTQEAVRAVPGFSEPLAERLLRWRRECERGFRHVEPRLVPEAVRKEAEEQARRSAAQLLQQGLACEAHWNRARLAYVKEQEGLQAQYSEACLLRARLEARLRALG